MSPAPLPTLRSPQRNTASRGFSSPGPREAKTLHFPKLRWIVIPVLALWAVLMLMFFWVVSVAVS